MLLQMQRLAVLKHVFVGITGGRVVNGLLEALNSPEYIERVNWERVFFVMDRRTIFASIS